MDLVADLHVRARLAAVPAMPPLAHPEDEARRLVAADLAASVAAGDLEVWVALTDEEGILGYAAVTPTWLDGLYVDPAHQRAGIGAALLQLVTSLRPGGFGLWVFESNTPARAFYARHGLVERERTDGSGNAERSPDVRMEWVPEG